MSFATELLDLLKAKVPGIWIRTSEEKEAVMAIKNAIDATEEYDDIYTWSMTEGINQIEHANEESGIVLKSIEKNPGIAVLGKILAESNDPDLLLSRVWVLKDYHLTFSSPQAIRIIRDLKESPIAKYTPIIIVSPSSDIPLELEKLFKLLEYDVPTIDDIKEIISMWLQTNKQNLEETEINLIAKRLFGFTRSEILIMLNLSYIKYNKIDLDIINQKKVEMINDSGVLDYKIPTVKLEDIGGNNNFKEWISVIEACMTEDAIEYGIPAPKGYLAVGIPGCAKSFTAEALAASWNVPFIKLNMSKINSRYAGETERNMAKALNLVKSCAPCVLLIDEVEKALGGIKSSNASDSGAIARAFGLVLQFLNDNNNGVFVVMTSNDVSQLPPELTRAGRLDAIFYFTLPTLEERKEIFKIHFKRINKEVSDDIIDKVAKDTEQYTGAEIELIVNSALRRAYLNKLKTDTDEGITYDILSKAIKDVVPISISSKEQILGLERWAKGRALFANKDSKIDEHKEAININNAIKLRPLNKR